MFLEDFSLIHIERKNMSAVHLILLVFGLIILSVAASFPEHEAYDENSLDEMNIYINSPKKYSFHVPFESKAKTKRPARPRPIARSPRKPARRSPPPGRPLRKDHPPGTHSPAGSSTAGGHGVGVGRVSSSTGSTIS